jgi:hypothetical protein
MNPPNGQTPLDYLNQIAPQAPKQQKFGLNLRTVIIVGIILVIVMIIVSISVSVLAGGRKEPWNQLAGRLATTKEIADDAAKKLKNSQIRSANTDLQLYLTNTRRDLAPMLTAQDLSVEKIPKEITAAESQTSMKQRLEDARLNAKFDSTYAREMNYQLSTLLALYQKLYSAGGSNATRNYLKTSYDNLLPIQKTIAAFSASNE